LPTAFFEHVLVSEAPAGRWGAHSSRNGDVEGTNHGRVGDKKDEKDERMRTREKDAKKTRREHGGETFPE
jgi:hypothetical protein